MTILVVTGTGTGVGKTVVTAAVAALALARGELVAVLKPAQTGVEPGEPGDVGEVARLVPGVATSEPARPRPPLAPATAPRRSRRPAISAATMAGAAKVLADTHDLVLVEGAGGLLVPFDERDTLADTAALLGAPVLVVVAAGLGTLNHTALTVEALRTRGLTCPGIVIGSWPRKPDLAAECNVDDLPDVTGVPLLGVLPEGAGALPPDRFAAVARQSLTAALGGGWQTS